MGDWGDWLQAGGERREEGGKVRPPNRIDWKPFELYLTQRASCCVLLLRLPTPDPLWCCLSRDRIQEGKLAEMEVVVRLGYVWRVEGSAVMLKRCHEHVVGLWLQAKSAAEIHLLWV